MRNLIAAMMVGTALLPASALATESSVPFIRADQVHAMGITGQGDLGILLADWGCTGGDCPGDLDDDGDTDHADLGVLLADWGCGL